MGSEEAQGLLWGAEPEGWASHESNHSPLFRAMMDATNTGSDKNVLDIGCGAGHLSALIKAAGATVVGVDAAEGMVDYANKTFDGIDFQVGGIEALAFGDGEFDVVFAANSVQYAADLQRGTRAPGPTQMALGLAGLDAVEGGDSRNRRAAHRPRRQHYVRHERVHLRRRAGLSSAAVHGQRRPRSLCTVDAGRRRRKCIEALGCDLETAGWARSIHPIIDPLHRGLDGGECDLACQVIVGQSVAVAEISNMSGAIASRVSAASGSAGDTSKDGGSTHSGLRSAAGLIVVPSGRMR
jgi:SAM-dependent methyltransferase